jgi:hypothetical protein
MQHASSGGNSLSPDTTKNRPFLNGIIFFAILFSIFSFTGQAYAESLGTLISPGDLSRLHEEAEGLTNCVKCHTLRAGITNEKCIDCHKEIKATVDAKTGYHRTVSDKKCFSCHTDHKGKKFDLVEWDEKKFDHKKTLYKLEGKHAKVKCEKCHTKKTKLGMKTYLGQKFDSCTAEGCHDIKKRQRFTHGEQFKDKKCEDCHTVKDWKPSLFKHEDGKYKGYKLEGKHAKVKCEKCHRPDPKTKIVQWKPFDTKRCDSAGCHDVKERQRFTHGEQFKDNKCEDCHTVKDWKPSLFKHEDGKYKGYKLEGKHAEVKCEKCHAPDPITKIVAYKPIETKTCNAKGCHDTVKKKGLTHGREQFKDKKCDDCHVVKDWKPSLFKHEDEKYKGYKLEGKHAEVKCEKCHTPDPNTKIVTYKPIETKTCNARGCHDTKERGGTVHGKQFKNNKCVDCHTVKGWKGKELIFDHNKQSEYKLDGKHKEAKCEKCHTNKDTTKVWKPLEKDCYSCHKKDDVHKGELGQKCENCHTAESWMPKAFFHDLTGFPLKSAHERTTCLDCHREEGKFGGLSSANCRTCHIDPHFNQFSSDCSDCHSEKAWIPHLFRHNTTGFRLEGAHRITDCKTCHTNRVYRNVSPFCYDCHATEFNDPSYSLFHASGNNECQDCHRVYAFVPATKHIHTVWSFKGAHKPLEQDCSSCHTSATGNWTFLWTDVTESTTSADCQDCHISDFNSASSSNASVAHVLADAAATCVDCHAESLPAWSPATYLHATMTFKGAHKSAETDCTTCHTAGSSDLIADYLGATVQADCNICHAAEFNSATTGTAGTAHATTDVSSDCTLCHAEWSYRWSEATFGHTTMTFTGSHIKIKSNCTKCHLSNSPSLKFTGAAYESDCEDCHNNSSMTGSDTKFTDEHSGQSSCDPTWCSDCHKTTDPDFDSGRDLHGGVCDD